ncbi:MAG: hypothetical protein WD278_14505 [Pirellulales bacterium]
MSQNLVEVTEFVKKMTERRARQASAQAAIQRAKQNAKKRQQFKPRAVRPEKPVKVQF